VSSPVKAKAGFNSSRQQASSRFDSICGMSGHPPRHMRPHLEFDPGQSEHLDERVARELVDLGA